LFFIETRCSLDSEPILYYIR